MLTFSLFIGMPWGSQIDAFAMGCTIAELYTGCPLTYWSASLEERLAGLEQAFGPWSFVGASKIEKVRPGTFRSMAPPAVDFLEPGQTRHGVLNNAMERISSTMALKVGVRLTTLPV